MANESQVVATNQYGETNISSVKPIGADDGPIFILPTGEKVFNGDGVPTQSAPAGSFYIRGDGANLNEFLYINTDGGTTWSAASLTGGAAGLATPITGFSAGAGVLSATDTILQAFNKLAGNMQNRAVTANLLTGLAAGSNAAIASTDTILEALAKLQAQIDALP